MREQELSRKAFARKRIGGGEDEDALSEDEHGLTHDAAYEDDDSDEDSTDEDDEDDEDGDGSRTPTGSDEDDVLAAEAELDELCGPVEYTNTVEAIRWSEDRKDIQLGFKMQSSDTMAYLTLTELFEDDDNDEMMDDIGLAERLMDEEYEWPVTELLPVLDYLSAKLHHTSFWIVGRTAPEIASLLGTMLAAMFGFAYVGYAAALYPVIIERLGQAAGTDHDMIEYLDNQAWPEAEPFMSIAAFRTLIASRLIKTTTNGGAAFTRCRRRLDEYSKRGRADWLAASEIELRKLYLAQALMPTENRDSSVARDCQLALEKLAAKKAVTLDSDSE